MFFNSQIYCKVLSKYPIRCNSCYIGSCTWHYWSRNKTSYIFALRQACKVKWLNITKQSVCFYTSDHCRSKMNKLTEVVLKPLQDSIYMKPLTMCFTLNGVERTWDMLEVHDSVAIVIYNITRNVLVLVKQFRPAVYYGSIPKQDKKEKIDILKYPVELGVTIELCAGIVDKNIPLEEIAKEEILEECGYNVPLSSLQKISSYRASVGTSGSVQTSYYCEVTDDMKVADGGGVEDENIEVIEMTIPEMKKYISQSIILSPGTFLFGIHWFLYNKTK